MLRRIETFPKEADGTAAFGARAQKCGCLHRHGNGTINVMMTLGSQDTASVAFRVFYMCLKKQVGKRQEWCFLKY